MNTSPGNPKSLYRELTIALVFLVTLVSITANLINYFYSAHEARTMYEHKLQEYVVDLHDGLEWPLWNMDDELIAKIGSAFVSNDEIASLTIRDDQQRNLFHRDKPDEYSINREITIEHNGQIIGSVLVGMTLKEYKGRELQLLLVSLMNFALLVIVLLAAMRWLLKSLLKKPVDALTGAIGAIIEGKYLHIKLPETYVEFSPILVGFKTMTDAVASRESSLRLTNEHLAEEINEREHAEAELRRYKDHLEEEVQQRTADLMLARDAAETANKAKSAFLSSMSHELRTPLNAILGFSNMLRKAPELSREQHENLDIINRSGEHLLSLINDVLEVAKIEAGRVQLDNAPFDLGGMVRDVTDMMGMRAQMKGLRLLLDQSSVFPRYIIGDEARLRQILINLVGNAIKFTAQGGVTVRLGTKNNHLTHLLIEIEDSGTGIALEDQQRIFEPFVQLGEDASQKGTGLGLTITQQFVKLMGGSITLESTVGKGSLFRLDLPLQEARQTDVSNLRVQEQGEVTGLVPGQPEYRILIVEDQLENQLLLTKLMESAGFPVKVAENGAQGVELFQSWHPHLIWMDRRMPVMDGLEATRRIRALPGGDKVKIVAVTASAFIEQRAEMQAAGIDDFLRKPYRFSEIYQCLSRQLGVQYIYAGTPEAVETSDPVLIAQLLAKLPAELRRELHDALESLEGKRIAAVIGQVAAHDGKLHKELHRLAENFDYPAILSALQAQPGTNTP